MWSRFEELRRQMQETRRHRPMNICTDSAISNMPITRSSAVSTLSPSQRKR
jgi:hypothetical protein